MINSCPHCQEPLKLNDSQKTKIQTALEKLPPGNLLKLACPHCQETFELKQDGSLPGRQVTKIAPGAPKGAKKVSITPPPPPDIAWLSSGQMQDKEVIEDTPMVLILVGRDQGKGIIRKAYEDEGFLPVFADSTEDALDRMQFTPFAAIIMHSQFEEDALSSNKLHISLRKMAMLRRRNIHYTLVGPEFQTLYDLQALSYSANLVVNDNELDHFRLILKKSLHESQKLFGPMAEALVNHGKIPGSIWMDIKVKAEQKMKSAVLKDLLEAKG